MNLTMDSVNPKPAAAMLTPRENRSAFGKVLLKTTIVIVVVFIGVVGFCLLRSEPDYVSKTHAFLESKNPKQLKEIANSLENRIFSELSPVPKSTKVSTSQGTYEANIVAIANGVETLLVDDVRTISVSLEELNAWITVKLDEWLAHQGNALPKEVTEPMVAIEDETLILAFRYAYANLNLLVSFDCEVRLLKDHEAQVKVTRVCSGELPLAAGIVSKLMALSNENGALENIAMVLNGITFNPVVDLIGDVHQGRIIGLKICENSVEVKVRIEPKDSKRSAMPATASEAN